MITVSALGQTPPHSEQTSYVNGPLPRKRYEHERRLPSDGLFPLQVHVLQEASAAGVVQGDPSVLGQQAELLLGRVETDEGLEFI